jgi:hypothetical protein
MTATLAQLIREFRIEIVPNKFNRARGARQTCAGKTLERVFDLRGYDHLRTVVMSIVETRPNKTMLVAPVIWAVSDVLHLYPEWFGDAWLKHLDELDLGEAYERAKRHRSIIKPRFWLACLLVERLWPALKTATGD